MPAQTVAASAVSDTYTYCKKDKGGEMVGCDNDDCENDQWFHLSCLNLKNPPHANKWYCANCRKLPQFTRKKQNKKCYYINVQLQYLSCNEINY